MVHVVVPLAEVHVLHALRQGRDLLEDEVEGLRTGGERIAEANRDEPDPVFGETEALGHLERHGALETLTEVRIVQLPLGVLVGDAPLPPGWERRIAGGDRQVGVVVAGGA